MKQSRNSRRQHRPEPDGAVNTLAKVSSDEEALRLLNQFKKEFAALADGEADQGDWVTVSDPGGDIHQVKSGLWNYVRSRCQSGDVDSTMAAEHLMKRAIALQLNSW